ncbi:putative membrane protein [Mycobacterium intracellulare]|nr:putative membrane protein [Mycobacterium intracellulare]
MPTPAQLLPLPVVLPLIGAVLAPLAAGGRGGRRCGWR